MWCCIKVQRAAKIAQVCKSVSIYYVYISPDNIYHIIINVSSSHKSKYMIWLPGSSLFLLPPPPSRFDCVSTGLNYIRNWSCSNPLFAQKWNRDKGPVILNVMHQDKIAWPSPCTALLFVREWRVQRLRRCEHQGSPAFLVRQRWFFFIIFLLF